MQFQISLIDSMIVLIHLFIFHALSFPGQWTNPLSFTSSSSVPSVFIQPRSAWLLHWHHFKNILLYCTYFYNTRALVKYNSSLDNDFVKIFSKSLKLQTQHSVSMIWQWQSYNISTSLTFPLMLVAFLIATFIFFS